ncbi:MULTISPECIES: hypothetical protein [unclassified Methylobacterium]|uniref:hypothetical protein n=1 Tax=unclassified Methylobacterium TaxID=2615210 RepID=UPI0011C1F31D|nr:MULTISPECIES: hypothetical protein [unclassified Methylobacterium]QEE41786.1 hypothetical protein FVA80_25440 [Methylobacterium sp. WL1]TXN56089.1 hypothetical protein FV241_16970 [Methylobacterium sp. WL2]
MAPDLAAGHPAPQRHRVGLVQVAFGLAGAPLAWVGLSLVNYGLASQSCAMDAAGATWAILGVADILGLGISLAALWYAHAAWRRTGTEQAGGQQRTLEIGEGRTRFLALCGIVTSLGFAIGILFALLPILLVSTC